MKSNSLLDSFKYALMGIGEAFKQERNLKVHTSMMILVVIAGIYFKLSTWEWIACLIAFALVIGAEMINTSYEEMVNLLSPEKRLEAKYAKDIAAGAVLVFAFFSAVIGLIIFVPKIIELF